MDLGASPTQAVRQVLLPLLYPAIFASVALVFADAIDDFVTVRYLCASQNCQSLSIDHLRLGACLTHPGRERRGHPDARSRR